MTWQETPVFILAKDRKSCLQALLQRLEQDGLKNIFIVDTGSTYGPMLEYLDTLTLPILKVTPKKEHAPKFVLWDREVIKEANQEGKHFVYTDCDTVPDDNCPHNWLEYLYNLLKRHPEYSKAGLGLKLADLPDCYAYKKQVIEHEAQFYMTALEPHVFASQIDTTLALYKPESKHTYIAIRTGGKCVCRHLPWYYDSANLPEEELYYIKHLHPKASHWTRKDKHRVKNETDTVSPLEPDTRHPGEPGGSKPDSVPGNPKSPSPGNDQSDQSPELLRGPVPEKGQSALP